MYTPGAGLRPSPPVAGLLHPQPALVGLKPLLWGWGDPRLPSPGDLGPSTQKSSFPPSLVPSQLKDRSLVLSVFGVDVSVSKETGKSPDAASRSGR